MAVIDHHIPLFDLPENIPIVNPSVDNWAYSSLSTSSISLFIALTLSKIMNFDTSNFMKKWIILSCLGIISDKVPLTFENRIIVRLAFKYLNDESSSLIKFIDFFKNDLKDIKSIVKFCGYLNSLRPFNGYHDVVEFFITDDELKLKKIYNKSQELFEVENYIIEKEFGWLISLSSTHPAQRCFYHPNAKPVHIGILATLLRDNLKKPVCVITNTRNEEVVGELRGIDNSNMVEILNSIKDLLICYGGHPKAAGFKAKSDNLTQICSILNNKLKDISENKNEILIDGLIPDSFKFSDLEFLVEIMSPFGIGNPPLKILITSKQVMESLSIKNYETPLIINASLKDKKVFYNILVDQ